MAPENVLEKIQKLLDLQSGAEEIGSLEEANNAAEKVQRLLTKYNLEISDVTLHAEKTGHDIKKFDFKDVTNKKNEGQWIMSLYHTLCQFNYSQLVVHTSKEYNSYTMQMVPRKHAIIVGAKVNVEVIRQLALRLEERIRTFESQAWKVKGRHIYKNRNAYRRAFYVGACSGLHAQLRDARAREEMENNKVHALVVQNHEALAEAIKREFTNLGKGRSHRGPKNQGGAIDGYHAGRNMSIGESLKK